MKENNELERSDIAVDRDMEIDDDSRTITVYLETWFDVDKKFGLHTADEDETWVNMYGIYNPFSDTLEIACEIDRVNGNESFAYTPTPSEAQLIKDMIAEKIKGIHGQTPQEFFDDHNETDNLHDANPEQDVFVYMNTACSVKKMAEKRTRMKAYCEKNGYLPDGSIGISVPMSRCERQHSKQIQFIIGYCHSHGITKILVDSVKDIGATPAEIEKVTGILCSQGFEIEVAQSGQIFSASHEENLPAQDEKQPFTMGGLT